MAKTVTFQSTLPFRAPVIYGLPKWIIGADEVGRGCLAGPVTVGAVLVPSDLYPLAGVDDSKKLSPKRRQQVSQMLRDHPEVRYAIASVPSEGIDQQGIVSALTTCFAHAVTQLLSLEEDVRIRIDGLPIQGLPFDAEFIVKGDATDWVIGAASILAKVERDTYMADMSRSHPFYGWDENAGYGTAGHIAAIKAHGLCSMHRASFCKAFVPKEKGVIEDMFGV